MRHGLAGIAAMVDHDPVAGFKDTQLSRHLLGGEQELPKQGFVGRNGFADSSNDPLGDDEHVNGGLRCNVMEGNPEVGFRHDLSGNLSRDDFFEQGHDNYRMESVMEPSPASWTRRWRRWCTNSSLNRSHSRFQ